MSDPALPPRRTFMTLAYVEFSPIRRERINLAVLLETVSPSKPFLGCRIRHDPGPVLRALDPLCDVELIQAWLEGLATLQLPQAEAHPSRLHAMCSVHHGYMHSIFQFDPLSPLFDPPDPREKLEHLSRIYVQTPS